jgi:hypothetical protein
MSKFTFICQEESMPFVHSIQSKKTVEFNAETLNDIMNEFEMFLRGAGFHLNGQLDIVEDECEPEWNTPEWDTSQAWNGVVNSLMNPPKFRANEEKVEIGVNSYGASQPTISFPPGVDTITITGTTTATGVKCELCGLPKSMMTSHNCYDDNCPKGTWK